MAKQYETGTCNYKCTPGQCLRVYGSCINTSTSKYVDCECGGGKTGCAICFGDGFRLRTKDDK